MNREWVPFGTEQHRRRVVEDASLVPGFLNVLKLLGRDIERIEPDAMTPEARRLMRGRIRRARKGLMVMRHHLECGNE